MVPDIGPVPCVRPHPFSQNAPKEDKAPPAGALNVLPGHRRSRRVWPLAVGPARAKEYLLTGGPLTAAEIQTISDWILQGALQTRVSTPIVPTPATITVRVSPASTRPGSPGESH